MTNKKISVLSIATIPLAGTEVIPLVQSGSTVKVSISDVTAGRTVAMSNAIVGLGGTTNIGTSITLNGTSNAANGAWIQGQRNGNGAWFIGDTVAALGSGTGYINYVYGANPYLIYTNGYLGLAVDSSWNTTFYNGNLVQGTAAKGINFTANTPAAGMTSQLLNWYEEGTWVVTVVPETSGTITLSSSFDTASYVRVGRNVHVQGQLQISSSSLPIGTYIKISLPFAIASLSKLSGRFGTTVNVDFGGSQQILFTLGTSGDSFISAYVNVSTATSPRNIWFSFSYAT